MTTHEPGQWMILDRYRVLGELGRGAMGIVYKVHDDRLDRVIALKTIRKDRFMLAGVPEEEVLERFRREARAAGKLSHPGIVTIYDISEEGDDLYLAMECVDGDPLGERMRATPRMPVPEAARIATRICEALEYAHAHGVVHRDVKPDNIMCCANGDVKLTDFGIARIVSGPATHIGQPVGTPRYMAPEQWRGDAVDRRADVFAVGIILYEMLTGSPTFATKSPSELRDRVLSEEPVAPTLVNPDLPAAVDAIVRRAIAREPAERYATAGELAEALAPFTKPLAPFIKAPAPVMEPLAPVAQTVAPAVQTVAPTAQTRAPSAQTVSPSAQGMSPSAEEPVPPPAPSDPPEASVAAARPEPEDPTGVDATLPGEAPQRGAGRTKALAAVLGATALAIAGLWWTREPERSLPMPAELVVATAVPATVVRPEVTATIAVPTATAAVPTATAAVPTITAAAPTPDVVSAYRDAEATLADPAEADTAKLAVVATLASDPSDAATDVLVRSTRNPSILVSMAAVKALAGRPCARIAAPLTALLDDDEWQRRAWAAKILGVDGCAGARDALAARQGRETDARVTKLVNEAIKMLDAKEPER